MRPGCIASGSRSNAPRYTARASSQAATTPISTGAGSTGETIQIATASSIQPKTCLTRTIQAPARGSSEPADRPTSSSGTLMPAASANSATPPSSTSRVWLM